MNSQTVPKRRFSLPVWGRLLSVAILAAAVIYGSLRVRSRQTEDQLRNTIDEVSRYEPGWQLADLEANRITPPEDENSALVILKIKESMPLSWPPGQLSNAADSTPFNEKLVPAAATFLSNEMESIAPVTALARKLNDRPKGRFPHEWSGADWIPDLPLMRMLKTPLRAAAVLQYDSLSLIERGQFDAALANCAGMLNAGSSLSGDHASFAMSVRLACAQNALTNLERVLARGTPSDQALQKLQKRIELELAEPMILDWLVSERALRHECLQNAFDGKFIGEELPKELYSNRSRELQLKLWTQAVTIARQNPTGYMPLLAHFAVISSETQSLLAQPGSANLFDDVDEATRLYIEKRIKTGHQMIQSITLTRARLLCAKTAIAAERYRQAEHKWPERQEQLVPKYLSESPNDPFDNKPLRYRHLGNGRLLIYSIGLDEIDDAGRFNRKEMRKKGSDVGIELFPVGERGRPFLEK